jgi:hypothetical protein
MSSSSRSSSPLLLSPYELSRIVTNPSLVPALNDSFRNEPKSSNLLRNYAHLTQTITQLEIILERQRDEQEAIFTVLLAERHARERLRPIVKHGRHLRHQLHRFHPYGRTPTPPATPSDSRSFQPPSSDRSVKILPEEALARIMTPSDRGSPLSSYATAIDELPGSKWNPIVVEDEDEQGTFHDPIEIADDDEEEEEEIKRCERCGQTDHQREDCNTLMRTFTECNVCAWSKQKECNHYDTTPAWIKAQQQIIEQREMKEHTDGHDAQ